jgi:hypothetical protein
MLKGYSPGDSPAPNQDPAFSEKLTTGSLSAHVCRWKVRCHLLWIDRSQPPVHAPLLGNNVEESNGSHYGEKQKIIFWLDSGAHFSVLSFSPHIQSNDKVIIQDKSGQPLERLLPALQETSYSVTLFS